MKSEGSLPRSQEPASGPYRPLSPVPRILRLKVEEVAFRYGE
jgi:hypothetical protein